VSSEMHKTAAHPGAEKESWRIRVVTVTVMVGGYRSRLEPPEVVRRAAKAAKTLRSKTPARLYVCETLLEGLA
jgi:hypothetical protein